MKSNDFRIVKEMKNFIFSLNKLLINFPKKEKVLTDKIKTTCYDTLELIFRANIEDNKLVYQKEIIVKLSMIDFYLELAYKEQYISEKQCLNKGNELAKIIKMIYGWIKYECNSK